MKLRKTILALFLALLTLLGTCTVAGAADVSVLSPSVQAIGRPGVASPQNEETVWCTRDYNGKHQKRLWSITNGCWLTEWIDIGP